MAATARVAEDSLGTVVTRTDGTFDWIMLIWVFNAGGPWLSPLMAAVIINSLSNTTMPTALERAVAYRHYVNSMPGATNTVPENVLGADIIQWVRP